MKKQNPPAKNTTPKRGKTIKPKEKLQLADTDNENAILDVWGNMDIFHNPKKQSKTARRISSNVPRTKSRHAPRAETYVLREIPTSFQALTFDTLSRKICQDIFLKASLLQGHHVRYVPSWETYPLWLEEHIVNNANTKSPIKISVIRKRCRAQHKRELEVQKQKLYQLGIFADWDAALKTLESRQEARLIALISRLRDSNYLHDIPQLSPWCPRCTAPINEANLIQKPIHALNGYVKFPFNFGLEEFGVNVAFCIRMTHLWEIAGTVEIGIAENATYLLTKYSEEYLLFAKPQLEYFAQHLTNGQPQPKPIKEIKAAELTQYTVTHPLFPSKELKITAIPETTNAPTADLKSGVIPLNPAHHQSSYDIAKALNINATPIFDENGKFTEEAGLLCGLYLFEAEKFILPQLERYESLLKTHHDEIHEPHCPRCNELTVFRPCSEWLFSIPENDTINQSLRSQEYWDNYGDIEPEYISKVRDTVLKLEKLKVSAQRQWGMPLPILLCDQCDEPLTDKNALNAIRSSIHRSSDFWFGLSIEELLPTDTRCLNCNSSDFRKESTLIDSHFANLLQIIDNSDFKKVLGGPTSVMFIPKTGKGDTEWTKWLAEISVLSATLSRSRPIKESQPFKQLTLKTLPNINSKIQIKDAFLDTYPADVIRLIAMTPDVTAKRMNYKQLEKLAEDRFEGYRRLHTLFNCIEHHLYPFISDVKEAIGRQQSGAGKYKQQDTTANSSDPHTEFVYLPTDITQLERRGSTIFTGEMLPVDSMVITVTAHFLQKVQLAYEEDDFHKVWCLLMPFCLGDLSFYAETMSTYPADAQHTARSILSELATLLLQRLAPLTPFLAEHFYRRISVDGITGDHSIFQGDWHLQSDLIRQGFQSIEDMSNYEILDEWDNLKAKYDAQF